MQEKFDSLMKSRLIRTGAQTMNYKTENKRGVEEIHRGGNVFSMS